jgi:P-type E1-E2 ATPase
VKGGAVLEQLARARTVAFDKTGTLTRGTPEITEIRPSGGISSDELLTAVAEAEEYSSHVLAASFLRAADARGLVRRGAESAREVATNGVEAVVAGRRIVVGKFAFVAEHAPDAVRTPIAPGELAVYAAIDGRYAGAILASDVVRPEAPDMLARLDALGIRHTLMLTGDARETAEHVAAALGIGEVQAECLPADKVAAIQHLDERPVVMVGDGVNDAPVLAAAEVGVAMGAKGATAASESADVVVLVDDIGRVADAITIGRRTVRVALQSIWIGIGVSVALMLVASFGLIPATVGALLQELVDLVTILAALRAVGSRRDDAPGPRAPNAPQQVPVG